MEEKLDKIIELLEELNSNVKLLSTDELSRIERLNKFMKTFNDSSFEEPCQSDS